MKRQEDNLLQTILIYLVIVIIAATGIYYGQSILVEEEKVIKGLEANLEEIKQTSKELEITIDDLEAMAAIEVEPVSSVVVEATAYCPCEKCCGEYANGYTSTGTKCIQGRTIAVDPKVIPYGSKIYIPYLDKVFTAEDCGGAIKQNKIDIYFDSHQDALKFGKRKLKIYILK